MTLVRIVLALFFSFFIAESSFCAPKLTTALGVVQYCWEKVQCSFLSIQERQDFAAIGFTTIVTGIAPLYQREGKELVLSNNLEGQALGVTTQDLALTKVQIMGLSRTKIATHEQALLYMSITATAAGLGIDIISIVEKAQSLNTLRPWKRHLDLLHNLSSVIQLRKALRKTDKDQYQLDEYFHTLNYKAGNIDAYEFLDRTIEQITGSSFTPDNKYRLAGIQDALIQANSHVAAKLPANNPTFVAPEYDLSWMLPPPASDHPDAQLELEKEKLKLEQERLKFERQKFEFAQQQAQQRAKEEEERKKREEKEEQLRKDAALAQNPPSGSTAAENQTGGGIKITHGNTVLKLGGKGFISLRKRR